MGNLFGGGTQQTTSVSEPPAAFKPLLNQIGTDALKFYKDGSGSGIYTGSTVIPFSQQTTQGMNGVTNLANKNIMGQNGLDSNLQHIIRQGGFNDYQQGSLNSLQNMLGRLGPNGLTNSQDSVLGKFQNTLGGLGPNGLTNAQDNALQNYRQLANSDYSLNANPGAKGVLDASIRDATNAVNLNAAAAGRYGSGVHEGVLAQKIGDLSNNFRYNDYNNWLGRRDAANQNMAGLSEQGLGNIQNMGQGINALAQQGVGNNQSLSGTLFNAGQSGLANMTNAYQGQQLPYNDLFKVGAMNEDLANREMQDKLRIWDAKNNQPWAQLQRLTGALAGGDPYKSTTTTAPGPNPFLQTLGGLGFANTLLGSGTGGLFNPQGLFGNPFSGGLVGSGGL
jgi:hypothetical protein